MGWRIVLVGLSGCGGDRVGLAEVDAGGSCPDPRDVDCAPLHDVEAAIELGTGRDESDEFEPLPPDGRMTLYYGTQRGYHVWLQTRVSGFCPNGVRLTRTIEDPILRHQYSTLRMVPTGDGRFVFPSAQPTFICPSNTPGVSLVDRPLDVLIEVEEHAACDTGLSPRKVEATFHVIPTCQENDILCREDWEEGCAAPP